FQFVSDVLPLASAERLFDYLVIRKAPLTADMQAGKGAGLVLLRTCTLLMKRLSRAQNAVMCGRILMYLADVFPLNDRSGVGLRGEF
ncbi:hypothetical protein CAUPRSCDRAFT_3727, partial [Caulochytrium protostelioides]